MRRGILACLPFIFALSAFTTDAVASHDRQSLPTVAVKPSSRQGLGIYDYRNRSFDPATGRFLQRDPVLGGDPLYNPYCFPSNNPVTNMDPMGDRILVSRNKKAWDEFGKWYAANISPALNGMFRYYSPMKHEGVHGWWTFGDFNYHYENSYRELGYVGGEIDPSKLTQKDLTFLAMLASADQVWVFDHDGWREKRPSDDASWVARADLSFAGTVNDSLAWIGDKTVEWKLDQLGDALMPLDGAGAPVKVVAWAGRVAAAGRVIRVMAGAGRLGASVAAKVTPLLAEGGLLAKLTGTAVAATPELGAAGGKAFVNIDTGTAHAFVSEGSLVRHELKAAVAGKQMVMTETARGEFTSIISKIAGPKETARAERFLCMVQTVPDAPSVRAMGLKLTGSVGYNDRLIFGTGDFLGIRTFTSDAKFVRGASAQGVNFDVFIHPPVPLKGQ